MAKTRESSTTTTIISPAVPGTVISSKLPGSFLTADVVTITALLTGATGGTLDVLLQYQAATNVWVDWVRFPQITAAAAQACYQVSSNGTGTSTILTSSISTDVAVGTGGLAANAMSNIQPNGPVRVVFIAGASTSAGASQSFIVTCFRSFT